MAPRVGDPQPAPRAVQLGGTPPTPTPRLAPSPTPTPAPPVVAQWRGQDGYTPASAPAQDKGALGHVGDFGVGLYEGGKDLVTGLGGMAQGAWNLTGGWLTNPDASRRTVETLKNVGSAVVENPGGVVDAVTEPYKKAWAEGRPGEAIGRGTFEVLSVVVGTKGLDKLAKGSKLAGAADDVARVANKADDAARAGNRVDDVVRAGSKVDDAAPAAPRPPAAPAAPPPAAAPAAAAPEAAAAADEAAKLAALRAPGRRHTLRHVDQRTVAKDVNSVFEPSVDVAGDVAKIRAGQAERVGDKFVVNGRTYGHHDGTLYPMSGPGIHTLDRGAFKALGVYNKFGGETEAATKILDNMGIGAEERAAALRAWQSGQP